MSNKWDSLSKQDRTKLLTAAGLPTGLAQLNWSGLQKSERKKLEKGSGWFEAKKPIMTVKGIEHKAPEHHKVAVKKEAGKANNKPMERKEGKEVDNGQIEIKIRQECADITASTLPYRDALIKMKKDNPEKYATEFLQKNPIGVGDIDYYSGRAFKNRHNPHGIPNAIWQDAWKNVGGDGDIMILDSKGEIYHTPYSEDGVVVNQKYVEKGIEVEHKEPETTKTPTKNTESQIVKYPNYGNYIKGGKKQTGVVGYNYYEIIANPPKDLSYQGTKGFHGDSASLYFSKSTNQTLINPAYSKQYLKFIRSERTVDMNETETERRREQERIDTEFNKLNLKTGDVLYSKHNGTPFTYIGTKGYSTDKGIFGLEEHYSKYKFETKGTETELFKDQVLGLLSKTPKDAPAAEYKAQDPIDPEIPVRKLIDRGNDLQSELNKRYHVIAKEVAKRLGINTPPYDKFPETNPVVFKETEERIKTDAEYQEIKQRMEFHENYTEPKYKENEKYISSLVQKAETQKKGQNTIQKSRIFESEAEAIIKNEKASRTGTQFEAFLSTLSPMQAGKAKKDMAALIRTHEGTVMTKQAWIESKAANGGKIGVSKSRQYKKEEELERQIEIMRRDVPANENHPDYKRYMDKVNELKNGIYKEELHIEMPNGTMNTISKTEADYFNYLTGHGGN